MKTFTYECVTDTATYTTIAFCDDNPHRHIEQWNKEGERGGYIYRLLEVKFVDESLAKELVQIKDTHLYTLK